MAKITLVAAIIVEGVDGDQPYRMILDGIVDESAIGHHVSVFGEGSRHSLAAIAITGGDVEGCLQRRKEFSGVGKFRRPAMLGHITGVNDGVGHGIKVVNVGDAGTQVILARTPAGVLVISGF